MTSEFRPREVVSVLPRRPGVYVMRDRSGHILYVGKARDLKRRVGSYFGRKALDGKTLALLRVVSQLEVTVTSTEQEALLLEYNLIKAHKPRFNVVLRDDKSYPYIYVSTEHAFPRFEFHRGPRSGVGRYLGPFPNAGAVRLTLQQLQRLFRVRQCTDTFFGNRSRPCLQYQIRRCSAPCVGHVSAEDYQRDVDDAIRFISGRGSDVLADLVNRMEHCSATQSYEQAARFRDQIAEVRRVQAQQLIAAGPETDLDAVAAVEEHGVHCVAVLMMRGGRMLGTRAFHPQTEQGTSPAELLAAFLLQHYLGEGTPSEILLGAAVEDSVLLGQVLSERCGHAVTVRHGVRGKRRRWLEMAAENARQSARGRAAASATIRAQFAELATALQLPATPERIECFDVSHTQGGEAVASCIAFGPDGAIRADYRRFNVRSERQGDDYAAMAEALSRRYRQGRNGEGALPDLVLLDGGRGQLARAVSVLAELGLHDIAVRGVAKGEGRRSGYERIYQPGRQAPLAVPSDGGAFHLLQQIRDEAHRFAIRAHRGRRARRQTGSVLDAIDGLGPKRRRALLQRFGGMQGIVRAGTEDLARTPGISKPLAERIYRHLHDAPQGGADH